MDGSIGYQLFGQVPDGPDADSPLRRHDEH